MTTRDALQNGENLTWSPSSEKLADKMEGDTMTSSFDDVTRSAPLRTMLLKRDPPCRLHGCSSRCAPLHCARCILIECSRM